MRQTTSDRPDWRNPAVSAGNRLRPPPPWDPTRNQYKDWLHLNVFDYATGSIALINTSLHGAPDDPRSRVMGTAVAHIPGKGWLGNVEVAGFEDAAIGTGSIGLSRTGIAIDPNSGSILASVRDQRAGLSASFSALPITASIDIEDGLPLGRGWISWYVVPRLAASGDWMLAERRIDLATAGVYQDHTWGRWHWGEDFGWEWGCFLAEDGATFVIARTTNRAHTQLSKLMLIMQVGSERRTMSGTSIEVTYRGELSSVSRRLPGAMAALHQDRAQPALPRTLMIRANDGIDTLEIEFSGRDALQLIAGDPIQPSGYGFIHEIAGNFMYRGTIGHVSTEGAGLGVIEYVD